MSGMGKKLKWNNNAHRHQTRSIRHDEGRADLIYGMRKDVGRDAIQQLQIVSAGKCVLCAYMVLANSWSRHIQKLGNQGCMQLKYTGANVHGAKVQRCKGAELQRCTRAKDIWEKSKHITLGKKTKLNMSGKEREIEKKRAEHLLILLTHMYIVVQNLRSIIKIVLSIEYDIEQFVGTLCLW